MLATEDPFPDTVFLIEDDEAMRDAISCLLESVGLPIKSFDDTCAFLKYFNTHLKGCLVVDIRMPFMSGLDLYEELEKRSNSLPVIFITGHGDIGMAVRAIKAGAFDFITKPFNNQMLLDRIHQALTFTPLFAIRSHFSNYFTSLTAREKEVLIKIMEGKLNKEIAHDFNISISAVELHRRNIMKKTESKNLVDLIKKYMVVHGGHFTEGR